MNINNTMQMDVLDILFANRNKTYGAYQLRRNYNKRLSIAIAVMLSVCLLFTLVYGLGKKDHESTSVISMKEVNLKKLPEDKPAVQPPPIKQVQIEKPMATIQVTPPVLAEVVDVPPPTIDDMDNVRIDVKTTQGEKGDYIAPPVEVSTGTTQSLVIKEDYEKIFTVVQEEAQFPGGLDAWKKFLQQNLRSDVPTENGAPVGSYTVMVSFIVNKEGNISEVKVEKDPGYGMGAEAMRVIQRGPTWIPALQNGRSVIYRQLQAITFVVSQE